MNTYCSECSDYVEVHPERGKDCSFCNPGNLGDDDLQPLYFSDESDRVYYEVREE